MANMAQVNEVMEMIIRGNDLRTMSPTEANATSSRSHAVLQINVSSKDRNASVNEPHTMATLSIIDLAGSERASATKNRGARLTEGANINKSLLALGSCINALCDMRKHNHIPYRNSKLTRLLKFSLGGNCKTVMIVCVSPSSVHFDETQNTLRYANRAKNIQTKVTKNVFNVNRHVKDYLKKIDEQRALIEELMKKQKDSDSASLAKVQKQNEKKEAIMRDAFIRLRQAYADSETDRRDRLNIMRTLKHTEKRIALVSAWVAAFDTVCETREDEEMPSQITTMRDTAIGISAELEQSRQHHHRRLERSTWGSKLDTALNFGLRQLTELDGTTDGPDAANLTREYQILRSNAERETLSVLLEQERGGDAATVQVLVQAHIETVAILGQITQMDEAQAVETARKLLTKIMNACTSATAQVIRPDGGFPVTEFFEPSQKGTPKRRKPVEVKAPSPVKSIPMPSFADAPHLTSSPMKASPRRKKMIAVKKGIQFSPAKKRPTSPSKSKRGVRWRDDNGNGTLADFKTPEHVESTPTSSSFDIPPPTFTSYSPAPEINDTGSSPIPAPPTTSLDMKPRTASSRFAAGFLSKKSDGSPMPIRSAYGSDSDTSPLREIGTNTVRPSALSSVEHASESANDSGNNSAADEDGWSVDPSEANRIRTAIKRRSSTTKPAPANRTQRHRSPSNTSSSPPNENSISASAARRMVKNMHEGEWKPSVLGPRSAPIVKGAARRTTVATSAEERPAPGTLNRAPIRVVSNSSARGSGSLATGAKGVWRG
jgi:kinesin family protein 18/19